jgi:C_GCAxxG_C_C family probable redox protein
MDRIEKAAGLMRDGNNCGMTILAAFGEKYGLDKNLALKIGRPLGAGMGLMGLTCGAVSAGFLALGLAVPEDQEESLRRSELYAKIRELTRLFEERNITIVCRDLLGLDLGTKEGAAEAKARNMAETHCLKFVRDVAEILEEMI